MNTLVGRRYLIVFLLMTILSVPFMGRGLFESSEGRYARVAQTMVQQHDFWIPKLNGKPHLTKPPLTYWVIAAGIDMAGANTVGARLFHTIIWIITGLIIVRIGSEIGSPRLGYFSGLIFSTSLLPSIGSWSLTTDPILVFFVAFYLLALVRYEKEKSFQSALIFWSMVGFSLLTKGPVALLPLLFLMIKWRKIIVELIKTHLWIVGILIGLGWYIMLEIKNPGILLKLIKDELILRSTTDISGRNPFWWAPIVVYGTPFMIGWGLWPFLAKKERFLVWFKSPVITWQKSMLVWIVLSLIFFSFIQSRLTLYILPLTIPMSLLLGDLIQNNKNSLRVALINCVLIFALKSYGTFIYQSEDNSLQLTAFAEPVIRNGPIHLLWEKSLFGVEFYLPGQFKKEIDPFSTLNSSYSSWVLYQEKRQKIFKKLLEYKKLQVRQSHSYFKWKLLEVVPAQENSLGASKRPSLEKSKF